MWRIEDGKAVTVERTALANERLLEDILETDIGLLGLPNQLLVIGRQVVTEYSGRVDLLCVDQEGTLYAVEIKKERTPREVVAQAMDYGTGCAISAMTMCATSTLGTRPVVISTRPFGRRFRMSHQRRSTPSTSS
jgi:hypothetical protein